MNWKNILPVDLFDLLMEYLGKPKKYFRFVIIVTISFLAAFVKSVKCMCEIF